MINAEKLTEFVAPYYKDKDIMHDMSHIGRVIRSARRLMQFYPHVDQETTIVAAHFHGMIDKDEAVVRHFLLEQSLDAGRIDFICQVARESLKHKAAQTPEGQILHDAHLIEGGKTYIVVKCLVTGTARGQTLEQTIDIMEHRILGKFQCYLPEAIQMYKEMHDFAEQFIGDLKAGLEA